MATKLTKPRKPRKPQVPQRPKKRHEWLHEMELYLNTLNGSLSGLESRVKEAFEKYKEDYIKSTAADSVEMLDELTCLSTYDGDTVSLRIKCTGPNPFYAEELSRYEKKLARYERSMELYKERQRKYEKDVREYEAAVLEAKIKEIEKMGEQLEDLKSQLEELKFDEQN